MQRKLYLEIYTVGDKYCAKKCKHYKPVSGVDYFPWCTLFNYCLGTGEAQKARRVQECVDAQVLGEK